MNQMSTHPNSENDGSCDLERASGTGDAIEDRHQVGTADIESIEPAHELESEYIASTPETRESVVVADALSELAGGLRALAQKQDELRESFESKIRSDEIQVQAMERLDGQLREYKASFVRQEMLPLLRDLIYCYDVAGDEAVRARRPDPATTPEESARGFDHLRQMVADVLAKYDVEPFRSAGPEFDRREQQCVGTVPTSAQGDDKKIATVGAIGFRLADAIIRKEQVTVYKFAPGSSPEPPGASAFS